MNVAGALWELTKNEQQQQTGSATGALPKCVQLLKTHDSKSHCLACRKKQLNSATKCMCN